MALAFPTPARPEPVVEYYNVDLGHYFLTIDPADVAAIEAGHAGRGWVKTGLAFSAYRHPIAEGAYCPGDCGVPVTRFYGTPGLGPNSHFFTASKAEVDALRPPGTGWSLEHVAFSIPVPDASGQCAAGRVPVHRLYNNRWMVNDSNHRYVTDAGERDRTVAKGWTYEGVAFCAYAAHEIPVKSFDVAIDLARKILPSAECEDERISLGPCLAINQVPVPRSLTAAPPADFFPWTGLDAPFNYVIPGRPAAEAAADVFVQGTSPPGTATSTFGIRVSSASRGPWEEASVNPLYQLRTTREADGRDLRFFPFGRAESAVQMRMSYTVRVKRIVVREEGGHAFGHPTLEFTDQRSGKNLYFTMLTFGTQPPDDSDYLAADLFTGKVIVGTTLRAASPYLRNFGLPTLRLPLVFISEDPFGTGGAFEFRIDRAEFQRVLDAARRLDPTLSADPADYMVDNFHFNNDVYRHGDLGLTLADFKLELVRR